MFAPSVWAEPSETYQPINRFSLDSPVFYRSLPLSSGLNIFPYVSSIFNPAKKIKGWL